MNNFKLGTLRDGVCYDHALRGGEYLISRDAPTVVVRDEAPGVDMSVAFPGWGRLQTPPGPIKKIK
jgi:hypothetical protein